MSYIIALEIKMHLKIRVGLLSWHHFYQSNARQLGVHHVRQQCSCSHNNSERSLNMPLVNILKSFYRWNNNVAILKVQNHPYEVGSPVSVANRWNHIPLLLFQAIKSPLTKIMAFTERFEQLHGRGKACFQITARKVCTSSFHPC